MNLDELPEFWGILSPCGLKMMRKLRVKQTLHKTYLAANLDSADKSLACKTRELTL